MRFENGMLSQMLLEHGYNTFCLGKWHLSPSEDNTPAGPFTVSHSAVASSASTASSAVRRTSGTQT